MEKGQVSIIIPVYNGETVICNLLKSILRQTYNNYEVHIVDDASTDNTVNVVESYIKENTKGHFYTYRRSHSGVGASRNYGLKVARGEYVCFVDADDILKEDYLENLVEGITSTEADMAVCGYYRHDELTGKDAVVNQNITGVISAEMATVYNLIGRIHICIWNSIYQRSLIESKSLNFTQHLAGEDLHFVYAYIIHCKAVNLLPVNEYVYNYDSHKSYLRACKFSYNSFKENFLYILWKRTQEIGWLEAESVLMYLMLPVAAIWNLLRESNTAIGYYDFYKKNNVKFMQNIAGNIRISRLALSRSFKCWLLTKILYCFPRLFYQIGKWFFRYTL